MRAWFVLFLVWMMGWAAVGLLVTPAAERAEPGAVQAWILARMCFYLALCNSVLPLPTAWIILLAASPDVALFQTPWLRVVAVAGLATLSTVVSNLNEYHLLAYLFRFGLGRRLRRTRLYEWAIRWFDRAPFQMLTLVAFIPIPIDAIRWLAVLRGYSRSRFGLAYFVGRGPRYLLFAWCSVLLGLSGRQILVIQVAILALALLGRLVGTFISARSGPVEACSSRAPADVSASADRGAETMSATAKR